MQYLKRLTAMAMLASLLTLSLLATIQQTNAATPTATTRYVAPGGNCGGAAPCYASIQAAVDAADPGDKIKVAEGRYTDIHTIPDLNTATFTATQIVAITKSMNLYGGYTPANWTTPDPANHPTILDAEGKGRVLCLVGPATVSISGLQITGGDATGLGGSWRGDVGGGLYLNNIEGRIDNNRIYSNTAEVGAGLFLDYSPIALEDNDIYENMASNVGGGADINHSDATISRNTIHSNRGGGFSLGWSDIKMNGNIIRNNLDMWRGGGLHFWDCDASLVNNVIVSNQAIYDGGGVFADASSNLKFWHTTIARNTGGSGVYVNTWGNFPSAVAMTNTIFFDHDQGIVATALSTATLNSTLWYANSTDWSGNVIHSNDHNGDPKFVFDGYHLAAGSAAIDKGVDAGISTDIDGNARPHGSGYDIGADEFNGTPIHELHLFLPLNLRQR